MSPKTHGLVQVYAGTGKGKTTASLGLALRACGAGQRVAIVFFDKGGEHYSERNILEKVGVDWFGYGLDRINPNTNRFRFGVVPDDIECARRGVAKVRALFKKNEHDILILDEINAVVALEMVQESTVERLIDEKPKNLELILTGRTEIVQGKCMRPSYFERADLISEMRLVKHYFYTGVPAREGIDY
ncbi:MAG: cob(I)yrinic acid a,c-diamide adenosyltransferase [Candidatus Uhrbacteria bacterium]